MEGYEWIINDANIMKQLRKRKEIDSSILQKCKEMQSKIVVNEWNTIETHEDINNIMSSSFGFHDSIVRSIDKKEGNQIVEVTFDTTWGCNIVMRFEGDVEYKCDEGHGRSGEIFGASIFLEDGFVYWVDDGVESSKGITQDYSYFKSRRAEWKIDIILN